jgi:OOP family OmpA-OmpF porin
VIILAFSEVTNSSNNDLYVSFKVGENQWTKPMYIKDLNTKEYAEGTPFLAADMRTIYFSSNRPGGMGDRDIWMSKRIGNSWKNWSEPVNLGPTVNTEGWDGYYSVDAKGEYTFMVVEDLRTGKTDIVQKQLKADLRPEKVVVVKGIVRDTLTMEPKAATIIYKDSLGVTLGEAFSNPSDGSFTLVLPLGKKYFIRPNVKDYYSNVQSVDLISKSTMYENKNIDLWVKKITIGENINLKSVLFYQGTDHLKENSNLELQNVVDFLKQNPTVKIRLEGHTDNQGDQIKNLQLSEDRVKEVKAYLVKNDIEAKRIETIGYGSTKPLVPNTTEELRQQNRRVEFKIIEM